jgi:hypothetical protein
LREIEVAHNEYLKNRGYATDEERAISFEFALDFLENKKSDLHQTISEIMLADTKKWVDASGNQTVLELLRNKAQLVLIEGWMICTMPPNRKGTVSVYSNGATLQ